MPANATVRRRIGQARGSGSPGLKPTTAWPAPLNRASNPLARPAARSPEQTAPQHDLSTSPEPTDRPHLDTGQHATTVHLRATRHPRRCPQPVEGSGWACERSTAAAEQPLDIGTHQCGWSAPTTAAGAARAAPPPWSERDRPGRAAPLPDAPAPDAVAFPELLDLLASLCGSGAPGTPLRLTAPHASRFSLPPRWLLALVRSLTTCSRDFGSLGGTSTTVLWRDSGVAPQIGATGGPERRQELRGVLRGLLRPAGRLAVRLPA
jgi:hypothetical protein